jgi:hypothetical protein
MKAHNSLKNLALKGWFTGNQRYFIASRNYFNRLGEYYENCANGQMMGNENK